MPTPSKGPRLGGSPAHERAILSNLATSLFEHGAITTTEAKARRLRPFAERLITKAKRGDLHNRRQVLSVVRDKGVVHILFTEIGPRYADRPGGYTRITKLGPRHGDNAPMAVIELVQEEVASRSRGTTKAATPAPAKKASRKRAAAEAPVVSNEAVEATDSSAVEAGVVEELETVDETVAAPTTDEVDAAETETDEAAAEEAATDESAAEEVATDEAVVEEAGIDEAPSDEAAGDEETAVHEPSESTADNEDEPATTDEVSSANGETSTNDQESGTDE